LLDNILWLYATATTQSMSECTMLKMYGALSPVLRQKDFACPLWLHALQLSGS